ncbi:hypothetical protein HZS_6833, partial [Henneguya salminicola]
ISVSLLSIFGYHSWNLATNFYCGWDSVGIIFAVCGGYGVFCFGMLITSLLKLNRNICILAVLCLWCLFVLSLCVGSWSLHCLHSFSSSENEILEKAIIKMNDYSKEKHGPYKNILDHIQTSLECCGWNDTSDWKYTSYFKIHKIYPSSCCKSEYKRDECGKYFENINTEGCF